MLVVRQINIHDVSFHQKNNAFGKSPHKVLLFLIAYKAYRQGHERLLSFEHNIYPELEKLLLKLGNDKPRPEYPFWRLQNDGIWEVRIDNDITENNSGDVTKKQLFEVNACGGFRLDLFESAVDQMDDYGSIVTKLIEDRIDANTDLKKWLKAYFLDADEGYANSKQLSPKKTLSRKSPEVLAYIAKVEKAKRDAEVVTLREWYDTTTKHSPEIQEYMKHFKNLGRLGRELHKRGVERVTERFADDVRTLVEATYKRQDLDIIAPLCALLSIFQKGTSNEN